MPCARRNANVGIAGKYQAFLCGDVMTGRGIDQIMAHPSDAILYEPSITSAVDYVGLAEAAMA